MSSRNDFTMMILAGVLVLPAGALSLAGCASTPASQELVDARQALDRATHGPAGELTPAQVLTAKQALTRAEQAFGDAPDAPATRDLAYIALRTAEIAEAQGVIASERRSAAEARSELTRIQAEKQRMTQAELSETRQELASEQKTLADQNAQLTAEQRARRAAERRATAAIASLEKIAAIKEEARGLVITLNGSVLFATGQSTLLPIAQDRLQQVAQALQDNPGGAIVVEGHTDSVGSQATNEELSRRRAEAVRAYLIERGVATDRIRAVGLGPSRPVADNKTPEGRANNRRVEIVIEREQR
jgi:outer membrane protein OmpA-like peptidoglycan-associated protein